MDPKLSRAERRRQQKQDKKDARNKRPVRSTAAIADDQVQIIAQTIDLAIRHHRAGELSKAVGAYQKILEIDPNQPDALNLLGVIARADGNSAQAVKLISRSLKVRPDFADAHNNLGNAFTDMGKPDNALASYNRAIAINPDHADAHYNLGSAFIDLGKMEEAFACQRRAVTLNPQKNSFWAGMGKSLESLFFTTTDDRLCRDLLQLLERRAVRPSYIIQPVFSALRCQPVFSRVLEQSISDRSDVSIPYKDLAALLSDIPLFLCIMALCPISDLTIERMLTSLRRAMILEPVSELVDTASLPFLTALALQCFTNEYVFAETQEERVAVDNLQQRISSLIDRQHDVPASFVAALGAYRPLYRFPWARVLSDRKWDGDIGDVIKRQIAEPLEELTLRSQIPCLTPIEDTISQSVREQYEENPYPRWVTTGLENKSRLIGTVLQGAPLLLDLGNYNSPKNPEILVAGCGTGQVSIFAASRFSNVRVLAVDLSSGSLSYAMRKARELGFTNIEYAQADILEMSGLGRQFDLIDCSGVLHHLENPLAGWQVLTGLLRPGGIMKIGLYSETARQNVIAGRALISRKGYTSSPADIRQCRQDIIAMAADGDQMMTGLCRKGDFFSLSNCRDMLFHIQEHRFTLPGIEEALRVLGLAFLGFEMRDQAPMREFKKLHPGRHTNTSLSLWHDYELENPDTFRGMYQFWCKKT